MSKDILMLGWRISIPLGIVSRPERIWFIFPIREAGVSLTGIRAMRELSFFCDCLR